MGFNANIGKLVNWIKKYFLNNLKNVWRLICGTIQPRSSSFVDKVETKRGFILFCEIEKYEQLHLLQKSEKILKPFWL